MGIVGRPTALRPGGRFVLTPNRFDRRRAAELGDREGADRHVISAATGARGASLSAVPRERANSGFEGPRRPLTSVPTPRQNPAPRTDPATRSQRVPSPGDARTTQSQPASTTSLPAPQDTGDAPDRKSKPRRSIFSLSADEFLDLAAVNTPDQIATQYGVKKTGIDSQLSKKVREKAREGGRTPQSVKDDLNLRRVANGVIPAADGRYGIRAFQARPRGAWDALGMHAGEVGDEDGDDEEEVMEEEGAEESGSGKEDNDEDDVEVESEAGGESRTEALDVEGSGSPTNRVPAAFVTQKDRVHASTERKGESASEQQGLTGSSSRSHHPAIVGIWRTAFSPECEIHAASSEPAMKEEDRSSDHIGPTAPTIPREDDMEVDGPAEQLNAPEAVMDVQPFRGMEMPMEVLHNNDALRLWTMGLREQAVERAQDTKQYLNDFILRPEDFD